MGKRMNFRLMGSLLVTLISVGCASPSDQKVSERTDTFEAFNRTMFNFNFTVLDPYVVRPVAVFWQHYMPVPARRGLSNFLSNLEEPASTVNSFLMGNPYKAMMHVNRFFLNSLLGMGGFIDVASMANPKLARMKSQRFGSTLGYYQVGYGPYVVLPVYGNFTLRDDGGQWLDKFYPMLSYLTLWASTGKWVLEGIETRTQLLDSDAILRNSSDPYLVMRAAYFQNHDFMATGGALKTQSNPNAQAIEDDANNIDAVH